MAFSSIPAASIQASKPMTQGLWTLVKNNDDSFNDGTGIGDGVISNRASYRRTLKEDCWEQYVYAAPPEWTQYGAPTTSIVALSSIYFVKVLSAAGAYGWTLNRSFIPNSGRTARFRAATAAGNTTLSNALGIWLYYDANNYVSLQFTNGGNIILHSRIGGVATNNTVTTFAANTPYIFEFLLSSTSLVGNIYNFSTGALIATATNTTNIPAASALQPRIGSLGLDGSGILVSESQFTTDALR